MEDESPFTAADHSLGTTGDERGCYCVCHSPVSSRPFCEHCYLLGRLHVLDSSVSLSTNQLTAKRQRRLNNMEDELRRQVVRSLSVAQIHDVSVQGEAIIEREADEVMQALDSHIVAVLDSLLEKRGNPADYVGVESVVPKSAVEALRQQYKTGEEAEKHVHDDFCLKYGKCSE